MRAWVLAALALVAALSASASPESDATIVLYNRNQTESRDLAKYYAEARGIPFSQVLGLNVSDDEAISRDAYLTTIAAPVRSAFTNREWWTVDRDSDGNRFVAAASKRFVAIIRGVPLKILPDSREATAPPADAKPGSALAKLFRNNEAAVDSELAALFALSAEPAALISNPYYRRLTPILSQPPSASPLLVCRLDAPTAATVRGMIADAIAVEQTGLWGWAYVDARNITSGAYKQGDEWLIEVSRTMRQRGIPVISDFSPDVFPAGYPLTDVAVYYGWYTGHVTGPFADPNFRFLPGAVACHLHSFSANTLRKPKANWSAPLLMRGAAATVGNVFEPYLELTAHFDVLQDRLMTGLTLAESAYASMRALSWMGIVLGDPLYRPYAQWIDNPNAPPTSNFAKYRTAVLASGDNPTDAAGELRALAEETGDSMFLEALGQAYAGEKKFDLAVSTLEAAAKMERSTDIRFRITLGKIEILQRANNQLAARAALGEALGDFRAPDQTAILDQLSLQLAPAGP